MRWHEMRWDVSWLLFDDSQWMMSQSPDRIRYPGQVMGSRDIISYVCDFVCVCVCPPAESKMAWAINTKLGTHILYGSASASINAEVKRSKVKVTRSRKPSRSHGCYSEACCCDRYAIAAGVGLYVGWLLSFLVGLSLRWLTVAHSSSIRQADKSDTSLTPTPTLLPSFKQQRRPTSWVKKPRYYTLVRNFANVNRFSKFFQSQTQ